MIECFTLLSTVFESYHGDSLQRSHITTTAFLVSPVIGSGSEGYCPRTFPRKNHERTDLMHINPPDTVEGFDDSHHPRYAEWVDTGYTTYVEP